MVSSKAATPEAYLAELPPQRAALVAHVRDLVNANLPAGYVETMNWGMISWELPLAAYPDTYNGQPLGYAGLAAQKNHTALYLGCAYSSPERLKRLGVYPLETCKRICYTMGMAQKAPTLRQFQDRFPTEDSCLDHLFQVRYGTDFDCPKCGRPAKYSRVKGRRAYQCNWCAHQLYPTAGTPFDRTRTPLRDWFYVMFLFTTTRNGVAAKRVERELGVTYKTAWRMCHEIRKYMGALDSDDPIGGPGEIVEIDETLIGGSVSGKGSGYKANKTCVVGMLERDGELITRVAAGRHKAAMRSLIHTHVLPGTRVNTDEFGGYHGLDACGFDHVTVNHKAGEYAKPCGAGVNTIEGFWAQLKRGINGTHIHVSGKHLPKYLGEFEYRWNMRQVPHLMLDRLMHSFVR